MVMCDNRSSDSSKPRYLEMTGVLNRKEGSCQAAESEVRYLQLNERSRTACCSSCVFEHLASGPVNLVDGVLISF